MELKIYLRQFQMQNIYGQNVVYRGSAPNTVQAVVGNVDEPNWIDFTPSTGNIDKLKLTWTTEIDATGTPVVGETQTKKSISGSLYFERESYQFIKKWLVDNVASTLNAIEAKITMVGCGDFISYIIKPSQITWCEDDICQYEVTLQQPDDALTCMKRTTVSDNWQGWFQTVPANGKKHPRFSYCVEPRTDGMLVIGWRLLSLTAFFTLTVLVPLLIGLNGIFAIINFIIGIIQSIIAIVGGKSLSSVNWQTLPYINPNDVFDSYMQAFIESAGCGREHPAPLIRDYILNACMKCGIYVGAETVPLFFSPILTIDTASRGTITEPNPYFNSCYLNAVLERGIRRFRGTNIFRGPDPNDTDFYQVGNSPLLALDQFLDAIKLVYNAEWKLSTVNGTPTLYFQRKDWYQKNPNSYVFDLTLNGADHNKIVKGICYTPTEDKYAAACKGIWSDDAGDEAGRSANAQQNSIASFTLTDLNPNFQGILDKTVPFGSARFRLDGVSEDYLYNALQILVDGAFISPDTLIFGDPIGNWIREYADFALLMQEETAALPKILIWDGKSYTNARAVRTVAAYPGTSPFPTPLPNVKYPDEVTHVLLPWELVHPPHTQIATNTIESYFHQQPGVYKVRNLAGHIYSIQPALLVNYPMYFEQHFQDTLWDLFHWIDDPRLNPRLHRTWDVKLELCCDTLKALRVFNDGTDIALLDKVKLPTPYFPDGVITEITASFDSSDEYGKYIEIKGIV